MSTSSDARRRHSAIAWRRLASVGCVLKIEHSRPDEFVLPVQHKFLDVELGFCLQPNQKLTLVIEWPIKATHIQIDKHFVRFRTSFSGASDTTRPARFERTELRHGGVQRGAIQKRPIPRAIWIASLGSQ
jgi:hypothetical protein